MADSKLDNARRNLASSMLYRIINLLLPFVLRAVLLYTVGVEYMGLTGLFTSIFSFLNLADLGFGAAIVYMMYKPMAENDTEKVCALLRVYRNIYRIVGLIILAAGLCVIPFLPHLIYGEVPDGLHLTVVYLIMLADSVMGYLFFAYRESLFTASQRVDILNYIDLGTRVLYDVLRIAVLLATRNYYLYCIVFPVVTLLRNLLVLYLSRKKFPQYVCRGDITQAEKKNLTKETAGLLISKISVKLTYDLDTIIISAFLGLTILAKFQNYQIISSNLTVFIGMIGGSITPGIGHALVTDSKEKNYRDMNIYQLLYMWLNGWVVACMVCLYQPFIQFWLGKDMLLPDYMLIWFGLYYMALKMNDVCFHYRNAAGLWWEDRRRAVFAGVFNLVMDIVLVKCMGMPGVLVATILYQVFFDSAWGDSILFKNVFTQESRFEFMKKRIYYMAVIILACAVCWMSGKLFPMVEGRNLKAVMLLLCRVLVVTALGNVILWLFYRRMPEYRDAKELLGRLLHRKN